MVADYIQKTYAGWLGKAIGIRMGAPIEGWSKEKIEQFYGTRMRDYVVDYSQFAADDDSNGPIFFVRALQHYSKPTAKEMGWNCLNYIPKEHGFFWWGDELSTEHTAFKCLYDGIEAPESGSAKQNGMERAEQIGGQIFIDCFGFVAPGNPELACQLAEASARVTHDYDGVAGARFVAACIALAYTETNIIDIMKQALTYIDAKGAYYQVVTDMIVDYEEGVSKEVAFERLRNQYWSDRYQGVCHIIPNAGIMAIALLYGNGNFLDTLELVNLLGFDTDCNAGNVGAIVGVLCGIASDTGDGIPEHLIAPIRDVMLASSVVGSLNIATISEQALLFSSIGYELSGERMPEPYNRMWKALSERGERIASFEFEHAIHGFRTKASYRNAEVYHKTSKESVYQGKQSLKIIVNNLHPKNEVYVYQNTYYQPEDLHDARYQPSFSPIAYPGDEVSCVMHCATGQAIRAYLYAYDCYQDRYVWFADQRLSSEWSELRGSIPKGSNALIKEVGVVLVSEEVEDTYFGEQVIVYMDTFTTISRPNYSMEFSCIPLENYSLHGVEQYELSGFTHYLAGMSGIQRTMEGLTLSQGETIYTGDYYWRDYECEVEFEKEIGGTFEFMFRCQGNLRAYALRQTDSGLQLIKYIGREEIILAAAPIVTDGKNETRKRETMSIRVQGNQLQAQYNDCMFQVNDTEYVFGMIGMRVSNDATVHLHSYSVRSLASLNCN